MKNISRSVHSTPINDSAVSKKKSMGMMAVSIVLTTLVGSPAWSGPEEGRVVAGTATISTSGHRTDIDQLSQHVVIDWNSFSIAANEHVNFSQPDVQAIALNRVTGGTLSEIFGQLTANGIVLLINPNGVVFSESSRIDVGGLVATTANISNDNFMSGNFEFEAVPGAAASRIVNRGNITAAQGGLVALVAPGVENSGIISARLGKVALAAGETFTLDLYGDQLISFAGDAGQIGQLYGADGQPISLVDNSGRISADGGSVYLLASDAVGLINNAVSMTGVVEANTVSRQGGEIVLTANGGIDVSGALTSIGHDVGESGGAVDVFGDNITVSGIIDASGNAGGGAVRIGGDFHGAGLRTASTTNVTDTATISADALVNGDGGTVVVWADGDTHYAGTISAIGGADSGDGGFVEVSGRSILVFEGLVDTGATNGIAGTLLLDPTDVTIAATGSQDVANGSTIAASAINRMLRDGMSVIIDADNSISVEARIDGRLGAAGAGLELTANSVLIIQPIVTNDGAIVVTAGAGGISMSGAAFLAVASGNGLGNSDITLEADGTIVAKNILTLGDVTLTSRDGAVRINDGLFGLGSGIGSLMIEADDEVITNGVSASGDVTIDAGGSISNNSDSVIAGGDISLRSGDGGSMTLSAGNANVAVLAAGGAVTLMTTGAVTVSGDIAAGSQIGVSGTGDSGAGSFTAGTLEAGQPVNGSVSIASAGDVNVADIVANSVVVTGGGNVEIVGAIVGFDQNNDGTGDGANDVSIVSTGGSISVGAVTVSGQDDLDLTADGTNSSIEVGGALVSSQGISLAAGSGGVEMTGSGTVLDAADDIIIATTGAIDLGTDGDARSESGTIQFGTSDSRVDAVTAGVLQAGGDIGIYSDETVSADDITTSNSGDVEIIAGGQIDIGTVAGVDDEDADDFDGVNSVVLTSDTAGVDLEGAQTSAGSIMITANGNITNEVASLISAAGVGLTAGGDVTVNGGDAVIDATDEVVIDSDGDVTLGGDVITTVGSINVGDITDRVGDVTVGDVVAAANVNVNSSGTVTTGNIGTATSGSIDILAAGTISAGNLRGQNSDHDGDAGTADIAVRVNSENGMVMLQGATTSSGDIDIEAETGIANSQFSLESAGDILLQSTSGTVSAADLAAAGREALLSAVGDVDIDTDTTGAVDINGDIVAGGSILIGADGDRVGAVNIGPSDDGVLEAGADIVIYSSATVSADDITTSNSGDVEIIAGGQIDIGTVAGVDDEDADDFDGVNSVVLTSDTAGVDLEGAQTSAGSIMITANGNITNEVASLISAAGVGLTAGGDVTVNGGDAVIDATDEVVIDSDGDVTLGGDVITTVGSINVGDITDRVGDVTVGDVVAAANVNVNSSGTVTTGNIGTATSGSIDILAAGTISAGNLRGQNSDHDGDAGTADIAVRVNSENGMVMLQGATTSSGDIDIEAETGIANSQFSLESAGDILLQSTSGTVSAADLAAAGREALLSAVGDVDIDTDTTGAVDINGDIVAGGSILIGADGDRVGAVNIGPSDDGVLEAGADIVIYSSATVSADDITTSNSGDVEIIAGGQIDIGTVAGVDDEDADDFDGVNSVVLTSDTAGVDLEGAQTSAGSIMITANGNITNEVASLISAAGVGLTAGGDVTVNGGDAVIDATDEVVIDSDGDVTLGGDVITTVGSINVGDITDRVGDVTVGDVVAAANVNVNSSGTVTTGNIGTATSGSIDILAAGTISAGNLRGQNSDHDGDAGTADIAVRVNSENGMVMLQGATTSSGDIDIEAETGIANSQFSLESAGDILLQSTSGTVSAADLAAAGREALLSAVGDVDIDTDTTGAVDINGDIVAGGSILIGADGDRVGAVNIGPSDDGVLEAGADIVIYSSATVSADDITTSNSGDVEIIAGGQIDIGTVAGVDDEDADDFDGVNSVVLTSDTAGVDLEGAQTATGAIEITAATDIDNNEFSLISAAGMVLDAGGNVTVNGGEAVIDAAGEVDIDAGGNVLLGGDARSRSASLSVDAADIVVGVIDGASINPRHDLVAATDLVINASGDVTTGGLAAGQNIGDQLQIIASGDIDIGAVTGSADPDGDGIFEPVVAGDTDGNGEFNPDVDFGAGTGVYHVTIRTTDGNIVTNGIDAGGAPNSNVLDDLVGPGDVFLLDASGNLEFGGIWLDAGSGEIQVNEAILSGGIVVIGPGRADVDCSVDGDCPSLALNHNIFSEGSNVYVNANTTLFDGYRRVAMLDEDPTNGFGTIVVDSNGNPIDADLYQEFDVDLVPPDDFKGCSNSGNILACDEPSGSPFNLCTREGNDCPNRIDTFGELFRYVESNFRLVDGSDISNVIDRLDVFSSNFNEEASPEEISQANNRERRFAELLGSAAITIDTTVGIEADFRANVRFAGNVHREEGALPVALPDEVTGDPDTLGILPSYVNHTLIINTGPSTGQARFVGDVGSSSDEAFQLTLGRGTCPAFDQCVTDMYLGAFDLETTGQVVFEGANRLNSINTDDTNAPVLFFDYVGTEDNRAAPRENNPGSFSGSNSFSLGNSMAGAGENGGQTQAGAGATGGSSQPGSGADSGPTQSGSGATGGQSQAGTTDGSGQTQAGGGAFGGSSQAGNADSVNPGGNSASAGSNDPETGLGGDLGDPPPPDDVTPSNLDESQKQDEEAEVDEEESDDDDGCPKGATRYADYGNVPGELGAQGNVFEKCSSDLVAAAED